MPVGTNPKELIMTPPAVGDIAEFTEANGYRVTMAEHYANKLVKENPKIFKIVPYRLPDPFTADDLENIEDLNELEKIGIVRFGENLDKREGVTKARLFLIDAQERYYADDEGGDWPYEITAEFLNGKKVEEIKTHFNEIDFTGLRAKKDVINHVLEELSKAQATEE